VSAFRVHLWKEWREHRLVLLVLALLVPATVLGVAPFVATHAYKDTTTALVCVLLGALAMTMTVGGELFAREEGVRLAFLERMPGGLALAFRAKIAFFSGALLALESMCVIAALGAGLWRAGSCPTAWASGRRSGSC